MAGYGASDGASGVQPHFKHDVKVYDSQGRSHDVTVAFLGGGAADSWRVEIYADPAGVDTATHADGLVASGTITFPAPATSSPRPTPPASSTCGPPAPGAPAPLPRPPSRPPPSDRQSGG